MAETEFVRRQDFDPDLTEEDINAMVNTPEANIINIFMGNEELEQRVVNLRNRLFIREREARERLNNTEMVHEHYRYLMPDRQFNHDRGFIVHQYESQSARQYVRLYTGVDANTLSGILTGYPSRPIHVLYVVCSHVVMRYVEHITQELLLATDNGKIEEHVAERITYNELNVDGSSGIIATLEFLKKFRGGVFKTFTQKTINPQHVEGMINNMNEQNMDRFPNIAIDHQFEEGIQDMDYRFLFGDSRFMP